MATNEQSVIAAEQQIARLKDEYISKLKPIALKVATEGYTPTLAELLDCQVKANEYFNYAESFVGNSGLLGAHKNGKWITGFAETCLSILESYVQHMDFLRSYRSVYGEAFQEPSSHAYANMQRMVKEYLPNESWKKLEITFTENSLPIMGFSYSGVGDVNKTPVWQLVVALLVGCAFLLLFIVLVVFIPNPTAFQQFIFRGGFALSLAAIAAIIPGFLSVKSKLNHFP